MLPLPRLALGTIQREAETRFVAWAIMDLLAANQVQIQHYFYRCSHPPIDGAITATGLESRQLDSWLMSADQCRDAFMRGWGDSELAVVEGRYDAALGDESLGGRLDQLCEWLALPRVAILDVKLTDAHRLPPKPKADAIVLDRIDGPGDLSRWRTELETQWHLPVLGGLEDMPDLRRDVASLPQGSLLPREICEELGSEFGLYAQADDFLELAQRGAAQVPVSPPKDSTAAAKPTLDMSSLTIAMAYDEAFHCYFSDTFEHLESLGMRVVDFSPLRDEALPAEADIVYLGCGFPEQHAEALAENHCMLSSLREHVCGGKRIFADGGGLAYLCQFLQAPDGQWLAMAGILPARAHLVDLFQPPKPVEVTLGKDTWLAPSATRLQGYLAPRWSLEPNGKPLQSLLAEPGHEFDLVGCYQVLASRIQFNFGLMPQLLERFATRA